MNSRTRAGQAGPVGVTGWSVHLPDLPAGATLGGWDPGVACAPEDAPQLLGRKGLLAKEPATRMALCAVHRLLGLPAKSARRRHDVAPDPATAVVVSSNLGNCDTVAAVATSLRDEGMRAVSPLDAPNVSSNVIASTVAIWFGYGGPNLMVCSGHPAGLDAIGLGALLLTSGRADRVMVIGVEPADATAAALFGTESSQPLCRGAACVLLEPNAALALGPVGALESEPDTGPADLVIAPVEVVPGRQTVDLTGQLGHTYGALGVLQVAVAAAILAERGGTARIVCGDPTDGYRATWLTRERM